MASTDPHIIGIAKRCITLPVDVPLPGFAAAARPVQGLRILMPVKDPNQIDAAQAAALFAFYRSWPKVARVMRCPDGTKYKAVSIRAAVRRRQAKARK